MPPSLNRMLSLMNPKSQGRCRNKSLKAGKWSSVSKRTQWSGRVKGVGVQLHVESMKHPKGW